MMAPSRLDRLIAIIGPESFPPKLVLPQPTVKEPEVSVPPASTPARDEVAPAHEQQRTAESLHSQSPPRAQHPQSFQNQAVHHPRPAPSVNVDGTFVFDARKGEPAPQSLNFCPFGAVTKFCYRFVPTSLKQPLATAFFDAGKIFQREWDLYYISSDFLPVIAFVPEYQLQALLVEINSQFSDAQLEITCEFYESGLVIDFGDLPVDLRPRWLGHSTSRAQIDSWIYRLGLEPTMSINEKRLPERTLEAFKAKIELAQEAARNKSNAKKKRQVQETVAKRQGMAKQLERMQWYLGLRGGDGNLLMPGVPSEPAAAMDVALPAPYPFALDAIFIAVDVEAYEKPPRQITEVGIATLDTRDLQGVAPGDVGKGWHKLIRARHFRVKEHAGLVNHEFVHGCPDAFEFGESEMVDEYRLASKLTACFHAPFSERREDGSIAPRAASYMEEKRNLIIVGHDLKQDIDYCNRVGFSIMNRGSIIDTADTISLFRAYSKDPNARSLGSLLYDFEIEGWNLHNAGNDAVYTVQALLAICVKAASEGSEAAEKRLEVATARRMEKAIESAIERVRESVAGWDARLESEGGVSPSIPGQPTAPQPGPAPFTEPSITGLYKLDGSPLDV